MRRAIAAGIILSTLIATPMSSEGQATSPCAPLPVDPRLIQSIIHVESRGNPRAVSKKGACGLMQVRYGVWGTALKKEGIIKSRKDLFHPEKNVRAGKFILAFYLRKHQGDLKKVLTSYSGGARNYYKNVMEVRREQRNQRNH